MKKLILLLILKWKIFKNFHNQSKLNKERSVLMYISHYIYTSIYKYLIKIFYKERNEISIKKKEYYVNTIGRVYWGGCWNYLINTLFGEVFYFYFYHTSSNLHYGFCSYIIMLGVFFFYILKNEYVLEKLWSLLYHQQN